MNMDLNNIDMNDAATIVTASELRNEMIGNEEATVETKKGMSKGMGIALMATGAGLMVYGTKKLYDTVKKYRANNKMMEAINGKNKLA